MSRIFGVCSALVTMAAVAAASPAAATQVVLSFDTNTMACTDADGGPTNTLCTTNGQFIGGDYGSTTGLAVSYDASESSGSRTSLQFSLGEGGRAYSFPAGPATEPSLIYFTPAAGYEVSILNFEHSKGTATTSARFYFRLLDPLGNVIFTDDNSPFVHPVNSAYYTGKLTFEFSNGGQGLVDLDNLVADVRQVAIVSPPAAVPEPATWAMMLGGFGMAGAALRGRRKAALAAYRTPTGGGP